MVPWHFDIWKCFPLIYGCYVIWSKDSLLALSSLWFSFFYLVIFCIGQSNQSYFRMVIVSCMWNLWYSIFLFSNSLTCISYKLLEVKFKWKYLYSLIIFTDSKYICPIAVSLKLESIFGVQVFFFWLVIISLIKLFGVQVLRNKVLSLLLVFFPLIVDLFLFHFFLCCFIRC